MTELTASDLPRLRLDQLDRGDYLEGSIGRSRKEWQQLWEFARSFDGYAYFGGDGEAPQRLDDFNLSVRDAFHGNRELPTLDTRLLRACLFMEQQRLTKAKPTTVLQRERTIHPSSVAYLQALVDGIAAESR